MDDEASWRPAPGRAPSVGAVNKAIADRGSKPSHNQLLDAVPTDVESEAPSVAPLSSLQIEDVKSRLRQVLLPES